jgi:hypothetical protein
MACNATSQATPNLVPGGPKTHNVMIFTIQNVMEFSEGLPARYGNVYRRTSISGTKKITDNLPA